MKTSDFSVKKEERKTKKTTHTYYNNKQNS